MSSFFAIQLDTTPPQIEIISPSYTTQYSLIEIRIQSNEPLEQSQEIYIIDSIGNRHDLTFLYQTTEYVGYVSFNNYPVGIGTIYARLTDEVGNVSELTSKTINIVKSEYLKMKPSISAMKHNSNIRTMKSNYVIKTMKHKSDVKELK